DTVGLVGVGPRGEDGGGRDSGDDDQSGECAKHGFLLFGWLSLLFLSLTHPSHRGLLADRTKKPEIFSDTMVAMDNYPTFVEMIHRVRGGEMAAAEELVRHYEPAV